ncbi:MAG: DNA repair protein RecN, partial [Calditrichaeota bacterium]
MLKTLYIKNYILIDEIRIEFQDGLNVITGETGAGKSILVDALAAILGDSLSKDSIRRGESKAIFEACFHIAARDEMSALLLENDIEVIDSELIIRRELNDSGRSRSFVNDTPVPLTVLQQLGDLLVDLHGQHEHQLLLQPARHIDYLDAFADLDNLPDQTKTAYLILKERLKAFQTLMARKNESDKARELQQFQYQEIAAVDPQEDEEVKLNQEESILRHAEKLQYAGNRWFAMLYEQDGSVTEILSLAQKELADLASIDPAFSEIAQECEGARLSIEDISSKLQK